MKNPNKYEASKKLYSAVQHDNIRDLLEATVKKYPDNNAFILKKDPLAKTPEYNYITYSNFWDDVQALGTALWDMGLSGKRVAVISPNRYEWVMAYLAVLNGLGTVVPLDKGLPENEILTLLKRGKCDAVIFSSEYADAMNEIKKIGQTNLIHFICMDKSESGDFLYIKDVMASGRNSIKSGNTSYSGAVIDNEETSMILFTSGTTAQSKAVMLSHKNITSNIYGMNLCQKFYSTDVNIALLPLHHTFGSTGILMFLSAGATNVFCDGLRYIQKNFAEYKVSVFVGVPLIIESMHKKVIESAKKQGKLKTLNIVRRISSILLKIGVDIRKKVFSDVLEALGGHMRLIISGASALNKEAAKMFNEVGILTLQGYGLTETSPVLTAENINSRRHGSVGLPLANVEIKIVNPDSRGIGEIAAKGPNVMSGYYNNEEATREILCDGWFYTGDLGYVDKDGFLFITGRKKNVIVLKNGKNVFPEEMEILLNNLPYAVETMVFGYPKDDDMVISAKIVYEKAHFEGKMVCEIESAVKQDVLNINKAMAKHQAIKKIFVSDEPMEKTTTAKTKRTDEIKKILSESK